MLIDEALENINFPQDAIGIAQMANGWAMKQEATHGFAANKRTAIALDGFVMEIKKPDGAALNGKDINCYRNRKGFQGFNHPAWL